MYTISTVEWYTKKNNFIENLLRVKAHITGLRFVNANNVTFNQNWSDCLCLLSLQLRKCITMANSNSYISGDIIAYSESKRVTPISNKQFTKEFLILLHVTSLDSKSRLFRLFLHHRQISLGFSHLYIRFRSER